MASFCFAPAAASAWGRWGERGLLSPKWERSGCPCEMLRADVVIEAAEGRAFAPTTTSFQTVLKNAYYLRIDFVLFSLQCFLLSSACRRRCSGAIENFRACMSMASLSICAVTWGFQYVPPYTSSPSQGLSWGTIVPI